MFEDFYKLSTNPFRLTPDPKFCFHHPSYDQAYAYFQYALKQGEGFVMVTGRPGIGKTTLVKTFLAELQDTDVITARIAAANVGATDLLGVVAHAYGVDYDHASKASLLLRLEEFFTRQARIGNRVLLIVDEAQGLPHSALEELRLLADLQLGSQPLLQLFLVGQEKLRELMREPEMEQFQQRVIGACHLDPLDLSETRAYIEHRLHKADWKGDPEMSGGALLSIFQYSKGIPRHINKICTRLLLDGFMKESHTISKEAAMNVAEELHSEQLAPLEHAENAAIDCSYDEDDEPAISDLTLRMSQQQIEQAEEAADNAASFQTAASQPANEAERETPIMAQASSAQVQQPQWNREVQNPVETPALRNPQAHTGIQTFSEKLRKQPAGNRAPVTRLRTPAPAQPSQRRPRSNGITQKGIHQKKKNGWQAKLLALVAALGDYSSDATRLLAKKTGMSEKSARWSGAAAVLLLLAAIVAANSGDQDDNQPLTGDLPALAPNPAKALQPAKAAPQENAAAAVQPPAPEAAVEKRNSAANRDDSADKTKSAARVNKTDVVAPAIKSTQPPVVVVQPAPVTSATLLPEPGAERTDTGTAPATDSDSTTSTVRKIPDQKPPQATQTAVPVVAAALPQKEEKEITETTPPPVKQKPAATRTATVAASVSKEQKVTELLNHGWRSLKLDRLLIPKNNNAYHYFQRVLTLDPGNSDARHGLDQIVARYTTLARKALDNGDRKKAERYIARGFRVNPADQDLRALRDRMNTPVIEVVSESPPPAAVTPEPVVEPEPEPEDYLERFKSFLKTPPNRNLLAPAPVNEP